MKDDPLAVAILIGWPVFGIATCLLGWPAAITGAVIGTSVVCWSMYLLHPGGLRYDLDRAMFDRAVDKPIPFRHSAPSGVPENLTSGQCVNTQGLRGAPTLDDGLDSSLAAGAPPHTDPERMQRAVSHHQFLAGNHRCAPQCGTDLAGIYDDLPPRVLPNVHAIETRVVR